MRPLIIMLAFSLALAACHARPFLAKATLEEDGEVLLYLRPFPPEAGRLQIRIEAIAAVQEGGGRYPLALVLPEWKPSDMRRERLIGSGDLPPGRYKGLSIQVRSASLRREDGTAELLTPEQPAEVEIPFTVRRKKGVVLAVGLRYRESVQDEFRLTPTFSATIPAKIPAGLIGMVTNRASNDLVMFHKISGEVVGVIPTGRGPAGIALDQKRWKAYVALSGEDAVEVIDILAMDVDNRIPLAPGDAPEEIVLTNDGKTLLTANAGSNTLGVIDPSSQSEVRRIPVGAGPRFLVADPGGTRAYVFNTLSGSISVVDIPGGMVMATISTGQNPLQGDINRAGNRLYVILQSSPDLMVIDTISFSITRREYIGMGSAAVKVDPQSDFIYLSRMQGAGIAVYNPFTFTPMDLIRTMGWPTFMTIDREQKTLCLVLTENNTLEIVNFLSKKPVAEIDVGSEPHRVAIMGER